MGFSKQRNNRTQRLTLGELEALAGTWATWLLTFLGAGVTSEQASLLEDATMLWIHGDESAGDAELHCADLTGDTTAAGVHIEIILLTGICQGQRGQNLVLKGDGWEVFLKVATVYGDGTGTGQDVHAGDGGLAAACGVGDGLAHET